MRVRVGWRLYKRYGVQKMIRMRQCMPNIVIVGNVRVRLKSFSVGNGDGGVILRNDVWRRRAGDD